eukprot:gene9309-8365_t
MISGKKPFEGSNMLSLFNKILAGVTLWSAEAVWVTMSFDAAGSYQALPAGTDEAIVAIVDEMLNLDSKVRPSIHRLLVHPVLMHQLQLLQVEALTGPNPFSTKTSLPPTVLVSQSSGHCKVSDVLRSTTDGPCSSGLTA